jgi:hypothetical protein
VFSVQKGQGRDGQVHGAAAPALYRAPLWSRLDDVDRWAAVEWALGAGVCGVGGRLDRVPADLDDAVERVATAWDRRVADRLRRFAEVPDGAQVWTRTVDGLFHVGELSGPWRYDASAEAFAHDLAHVRPCDWSADPADPPPAVLASFARGGRNFQRISASRAPARRG